MNRNRQTNNAKKVCAAGLTAALAIGVGVTGVSYAGNHPTAQTTISSSVETAKAAKTADADTDTKKTNSNVFKDEAVYVVTDPSGSVTDITVADWLKNVGGLGSVADSTFLTDITNTKGDETFTQDGDKLTWATGDKDIYYQGKTTNELPVGVSFSYKLDGADISPEDLAGKSGSLEMTIKYTNHDLQKTTVAGKGAEMYTPFLMATAMLLPVETFSNVNVDNGQIVSDGDKLVVVGFGLPGLQESLDLDKDIDITIPDTVTITADVTNFALNSTLTFASSNLLSDLDVDSIETVDDLKDKMNDLKDASKKLVDGSADLKDGIKQLKDKTGAFTDGIDTLVSGLKTFSEGVNTLKTGVTDYTNGVTTLVNGVKQYVDGTNTLADGVTDYTNGADQLVSGVNQLSTSLSELPGKLTELSNGYSQMMNGINQLASKDNMNALSNGATALSNGITTVNGGLTQIQTGIHTVNGSLAQIEASYAKNKECIQGLKGIAAALPKGEAQTQLQTVITGLEQVTAGQEKAIKELKAATAKDSKLGQGINTLVATTGKTGELKTGADSLKNGIGKFSQGAGQLQAALPKLQDGTDQFMTATSKLPDSLKQLTTGATKLGKNSATLRSGADKLKTSGSTLLAGGNKLTANNKTLLGGVNKLSDASKQLIAGGGKLSTGATQLTSGVNKLYDGSVKLNDGMMEFNRDGINKLYNVVNDDLQGVLDRLESLKKLGDNYESFTGLSDTMDGSVKFIIKSGEIKNTASETNAE